MILEIIIIIVSVILFFCLLTLGWGIMSYNIFIQLKQDIKNQFSNIKTEYQRRADLFMNLASSVKGYAKHEKTTFKEVIEARAGNFGKDIKTQMKNLNGLDKTFQKMMLLLENYPQLKASENFLDLQHNIRETENRINIARTDYNAILNEYNTRVQEVPTSIIANMFGFKQEIYFECEAGSEKLPKLNFD
jgi:LemA protein